MSASALNFLNKKKCSYAPFSELAPGRYLVNEFFVKIDKKFNEGQNLLCMKIENGSRYIILPKRFMDQSEDAPNVKTLNAEPCVFVYKGKRGEYDLDFHFEAVGKEDEKQEVQHTDDINDASTSE